MYLIIDGDNFGFDNKGEIPITDEEYREFFRLQSKGIQFRIKNSTASGLFNILEQYEPTKNITNDKLTLTEKLNQALNKIDELELRIKELEGEAANTITKFDTSDIITDTTSNT